jgi:thiol-disulfide isomerase/thioredoxin
MLPAGERIGEFEAAIEGGATFSTAALPQRLLVGFFTPWCDSCHERLPAFTELARSAGWSRERVLAVVAADEAEGAQLRGELAQVAQVVVPQDSELVIKAFGVDGFPAFCVVDAECVVLAGGLTTEGLELPAAA